MARTIAILAFTSLCLLAFTASATTVLKVSVEQMTVASDTIVHGVVRSSRAETIRDNPRHIQTVVNIDVRQLIRGARGTREITLILPGGRVGDWAMHIPGMPSFIAEEEVVLFLEKTSKNWAICGLSQGKFTVIPAKDGTKVVQRNLDGIHMVDKTSRTTSVRRHGVSRAPQQTLTGLLTEVKHYLAKAAGSSK
ncbi:MAG: hypothetical protein VX223_17400 [Myxococcota bacterium]|nr:hypothetical protein [Myxococcota bacterium]